MRVIASLVIAVALVSPVAAFQSRMGGVAQRVSACDLLTEDIAAKYNNPRLMKILKPEEEPIGAVGTHCEHGRIGLQVNPFGVGNKPKAPGADWQPVPGIGDGAFYRPLRNTYAELIAWTGPNTLTIQLGVATGNSVDTTKDEAIALAKALIPKLK
jgi:hypothetical protein